MNAFRIHITISHYLAKYLFLKLSKQHRNKILIHSCRFGTESDARVWRFTHVAESL